MTCSAMAGRRSRYTWADTWTGRAQSGIYPNTNPTLRMPQTTSTLGTAGVTRAWSDANGNFVPDCDLLNPNAQDLRASGGDLCGVVSNTSFGQYVLTNNFDPAILNGWGVRPSDWTLDVSVQRQILPRASATLSYSRRWFHGFTVADNLALQPSDLTPFSVVAPVDPRLPGGGGYVVSGLYDVVPGKAGQVSNLIAGSRNYGRWYQYFNGIDATLNLRAGGFTVIGGTSTGQTMADNCDVRAHLPELDTTTTGESPLGAGFASAPVSPVSPYCHVAFGVLTQFRGLVSYELAAIGASAVRHAPEQARNDAGGQLRRAERGRGAVARTRSVRERAERDGKSAGARHDVRRSNQPGRRSRGQDSAERAVTHDGCARRPPNPIANSTGLLNKLHFGPSIDLALALQPDLEHVYVVVGTDCPGPEPREPGEGGIPRLRGPGRIHLSLGTGDEGSRSATQNVAAALGCVLRGREPGRRGRALPGRCPTSPASRPRPTRRLTAGRMSPSMRASSAAVAAIRWPR